MGSTVETVVVTPRSVSRDGHPSLQAVSDAGYRIVFPAPGRQPSETELINAMDGCVGYLAGVEPVSAAVLGAAQKLRVISRNGVGVDNIDMDAAGKRRIIVERALGTNARGVAELAFGHMLCAARGIPAADRSLKEESWERTRGIELEGRTLAVIGYGAIGRIVANLAAGFGMRVLVYDPYLPEDTTIEQGSRSVDFDEVLKNADVISLHCPPAPEKYVLGAHEIARMKRGAIIVNTAREGLMDPDAVSAAVTTGQVRAVTIDAFAKEPPDNYSFLKSPGVIATPHIGGYTDESVDRSIRVAVDNLLRVLSENKR